MPPMMLDKSLGQPVFFKAGLKLPVKFSPPSGKDAQDHYKKAFKDSERGCTPQLIPPWFTPAEAGNKYYVDACDKQGNEFKKFHDNMLDAILIAHTKWKSLAKFKDIKIAAAVAVGAPGCLDGAELESDIKNAPMVAAYSGNQAKYRDAVAKGVSKCFKEWQDKVTVPGLPWYPAFVAFPLASAPPMPNVPTPLIACVSAMITSMAPMKLRDAMCDALDGGVKDKDEDKQHKALFEAIGTVLSIGFMKWLPQQQVMMVMGKGPVPSYAPPYVPVGPVVGGDIISAPGHLAL